MKIIEARDGFINFEADESVYLSFFVLAEGTDKKYIAQVNQMKRFGKIVIGSAKILFLYNGHELINYDRTLPSRDSELEVFPADIIQASISADKPVVVGKTLDNSKNIFMDLSAFNKKTLISIDDRAANNTIVNNLSKQFEHFGQNPIILDMSGIINAKKYVAGKDFKLPLNASVLEFMFKSCLNDATVDSKAIIAEVFRDLSEYSKTVPFVPFGVLKSIVDEMVDKQHIFKLFILKNRLANFEKLGYFATEKSEVENLETILSSKSAVIDLSKLNPLFQNKFLEYIYTKITPENTQVILEASNTITKKNLKTVIVDSEVSTTLAVNPKFQYLSAIKDMFKNFIVEPTKVNTEVFKVYCTFLSSMQNGMYLSAGENLNYIPIVSEFQDIDDTIETIETLAKTPDSIETESSESIEIEPEVADTGVSDELLQADDDLEQIDENLELTDETFEQSEDNSEPAEDDTEPAEEAPAQNNVLSSEEIIAEIEEKSNDVIENISENLEQPIEIDLFGESDDEVNSTEETDEVLKEETEPESEQTSLETDDIQPINIEADNIISEIDEQDIVTDVSEEDEELNSYTSSDINEDESFDMQSRSQDEIELEDVIQDESNADDDAFLENAAEEIAVDDNSDEESEILADTDELQDLSLTDDNIISDDSEFIELQQEEEQTENDDITINLTNDEEILLQEEPLSEVDDNEEQLSEQEPEIIEPSILPLDDSDYSQELEEIKEIDEISDEDTKEDDVVINLSEESDFVEIGDDVDRQIVEDVDKVFTTMKNDDELEEISDSDLDLIDELNSDDEELEEYSGELEEISDSQIEDGILDQPTESIVPPRQSKQENNEILEKKEANTPIVPVYDADIPQEDMVVSDAIQQGDSVVHAKYGNGVVEKMIKYGTKTLFSINFENIGRRLLDPTLTEIKKL